MPDFEDISVCSRAEPRQALAGRLAVFRFDPVDGAT